MSAEADMMYAILNHGRLCTVDFIKLAFPSGVPKEHEGIAKDLLVEMPIKIHKRLVEMFNEMSQEGLEREKPNILRWISLPKGYDC